MGTQSERIIRLENIGKQYNFSGAANRTDSNSFWALRDVTLAVYKGEVLGVIGRNGAGKTTFLNILAGTLSPTEGKIIAKNNCLGLFNLGVGFQDELTGRENIFLNGTILGAAKKELEEKLYSIIEFSELGEFIDMPLGSYSQGMRLRLGFSVISNLEFDCLIIDEVLAVGDILFQNKCFQRLMEFKRQGKTLILTTQNMELIERFCERTILLDHGRLLFSGDTAIAINKYRALLNTEKFFAGQVTTGFSKKSLREDAADLIEDTKKWGDDISHWNRRLGTKEVEIDSVGLINKYGFRCNSIKSSERLRIKVNFTVKNLVEAPHFGVAIFRNDGVYCYGPNTKFDGYNIHKLKAGRGFFVLDLPKVLLAPGEYRLSIAVWDKNETVAFDYQNGCYPLNIVGDSSSRQLLNLPFKLSYVNSDGAAPMQGSLLKLFDSCGNEKKVFTTNEPMRAVLNFSGSGIQKKGSNVDLSIFRDDEVCCQRISVSIKRDRELNVLFPKLTLLPGGYKFRTEEMIYPFRMVFNRQDHGTVYLEHKWKWRQI